MRMNHVLFTGRLGRDPQCTESNGSYLVYLNVAENDPNGRVFWHKFIVLEEAAKIITKEKKIKKGDLVLIEGKLSSLGFGSNRASEPSVQVNAVYKIAEPKRKLTHFIESPAVSGGFKNAT